MFHELEVPGFGQFVTPENKDWWKANTKQVPGPLSERLCAVARNTTQWLIPGSIFEIDEDMFYNTALVISPQGRLWQNTAKCFRGYLLKEVQPQRMNFVCLTSPTWGA